MTVYIIVSEPWDFPDQEQTSACIIHRVFLDRATADRECVQLSLAYEEEQRVNDAILSSYDYDDVESGYTIVLKEYDDIYREAVIRGCYLLNMHPCYVREQIVE